MGCFFMTSSMRGISRWFGACLLLLLLGQVACSSAPGTCRENSDCKSNEVCNISTSKCETTGPSCGNSVCESGENCSGCPGDCACKDGQTCNSSGACEASATCFSNSDCKSPQVCQNKTCVEPSAVCKPACPKGQTCSEGSCIPDNTKVCTSDADCPAGTKCSSTDALCLQPCSATQTNCPNGLVCDTQTGFCIPGNNNGTQCTSDAQCKSGELCDVAFEVCAKKCTSNNDCPTNPRQVCYTDEQNRKFCVAGCLEDSHCGANELCDKDYSECAQKCSATNASCPEGQTCQTDKGFCGVGSTKTPCTSNAQCKSGEICDTDYKECAKTCNSDSDCPSSPREVCFTNERNQKFCILGCLEDSDCETNFVCDKEYSQCAQKCSSTNRTCPEGEVCNLRKGHCDFQ